MCSKCRLYTYMNSSYRPIRIGLCVSLGPIDCDCMHSFLLRFIVYVYILYIICCTLCLKKVSIFELSVTLSK